MTKITEKDVLDWIEEAEDVDLFKIVSDLVTRGLVVEIEDYNSLNSELEASYEDDKDDDLIREASDRLRRGEFRETLHVLAIALGRDFDALEKLPLVSA